MTDNHLKSDEEREEREDGVPKWVQSKLDLLRRRLADERKHSAGLRGDVGETDILIRHYDRPDHLLPRRSEISFLPDPARPDYAIECTMRDGELRIHGSTGLIIKPRMSNDAVIELEK
jgi:hypothetical protein